jgi:hypothetical protein
MYLRRLATLAVTASLLVWAHTASAQSPEAGGCALAPVSLPLFDATPAAQIAASPAAATPEVSEAVDDATIETAVEIIFSCINTGDAAYAYAVFTDAYLARLIIESEAYQPALELDIDAHAPTASAAFTVETIDAIEQLPDGRVSVTVTYGNGNGSFTDTLVLAQVGDSWLIDEVTTLDPAA